MTPTLLTILLSLTPAPNQWIQEMREWKSEQNRIPIEEMLNNTLMEYEHGCDGATEQEELLQLPSDED